MRPNRFLVQVQGPNDHRKQDCKGKVAHVPDLGEPSNVLQKSDGKNDRGLPGHFPGQDRRDQGHQQARGKEENRPETRGISACVIVQDQIHGIDLQDGAFVKLTRTPQLAVPKHLIKRLLRKPTQIQDRRLQRQPTSRKVSWFMLTNCVQSAFSLNRRLLAV